MISLSLSKVGEFHAPTETTFKIASCWQEFRVTFELVYEAYVTSGLAEPNEYGMRLTPFHLLSTTEVLLAYVEEAICCTATIIADGDRGLPLDSVYREEVDSLRERGLRLAEISCLADRRKHFTRGFPSLGRLMSLIAQVSARRGIDDLLIAVHPRHARFYERYLGFERFGPEVAYPTVRNRPAVALALDLRNLAQRYPLGYQRLFGERFPDHVTAQPVIGRELWQELRRLATDIFESEWQIAARNRVPLAPASCA